MNRRSFVSRLVVAILALVGIRGSGPKPVRIAEISETYRTIVYDLGAQGLNFCTLSVGDGWPMTPETLQVSLDESYGPGRWRVLPFFVDTTDIHTATWQQWKPVRGAPETIDHPEVQKHWRRLANHLVNHDITA